MSKTIKDKIIMGIDPGTNIMGFGIIKVVNSTMEILELNELKTALSKSSQLLNKDGRLIVVSFQSLEDRIVKDFFNRAKNKDLA